MSGVSVPALYRCATCRRDFPSQSTGRLHYCRTRFASVEAWASSVGVLRSTGAIAADAAVPCPFCDEVFTVDGLVAHLDVHDGADVRRVQAEPPPAPPPRPKRPEPRARTYHVSEVWVEGDILGDFADFFGQATSRARANAAAEQDARIADMLGIRRGPRADDQAEKDLRRANDLLALAGHETTPEPEARSAAFIACRLAVKHGFKIGR